MNDAVREWDVSENGYRGKRLGGRDYSSQVEEWRELVRRREDPRSTHFHLHNTLSNCTLNRSLIASEKHGYMGLAPAQLFVGDLIVVLHGENMCYILRKIDQTEEQADLAGQCYQFISDKSLYRSTLCLQITLTALC
jgi:hypothetical protein